MSNRMLLLLTAIALCLTACSSFGLGAPAALPEGLQTVPALPVLPDASTYSVAQRDLLLIDYELYAQSCHDRLETVTGLISGR